MRNVRLLNQLFDLVTLKEPFRSSYALYKELPERKSFSSHLICIIRLTLHLFGHTRYMQIT